MKQPGACLVDVCCFKAHCLVFVVPCLGLREINCLSQFMVKSGSRISRSFSFLVFSRRSLHACYSCNYGLFQDIQVPRCAKKLHVAARSFDRFFSVQVMSFSLFPIAVARPLIRC